jgi:hypothetical protein
VAVYHDCYLIENNHGGRYRDRTCDLCDVNAVL